MWSAAVGLLLGQRLHVLGQRLRRVWEKQHHVLGQRLRRQKCSSAARVPLRAAEVATGVAGACHETVKYTQR